MSKIFVEKDGEIMCIWPADLNYCKSRGWKVIEKPVEKKAKKAEKAEVAEVVEE